MAEQTGTPPDNVYVPPFPYPPWYALSTFYLGLLPIQSAAMLWFEINLVMLFLTVWFISAEWQPQLRLFSFLVPFLFIPIIGTLGVGQYDFPVLLGSAMLIHAIRHQSLALISIGAALLTFKPHIGVLIFLAVLIHFFLMRDSFSRRARLWIFGGLAVLCVIGLIADPMWFMDYPRSFLTYQTGTDITSCTACDSLPAWLAGQFMPSATLSQMTFIGAIIFIALAFLFGPLRLRLLKSADYLLNVSILITLLAIPHLYNYDFILLLMPFALLGEESRSWFERIGLLVLYFLPFFAILMLGRSSGDPSLLFVTLILAALVTLHARKLPQQLDVFPREA